jgi:hypothetical protein
MNFSHGCEFKDFPNDKKPSLKVQKYAARKFQGLQKDIYTVLCLHWIKNQTYIKLFYFNSNHQVAAKMISQRSSGSEWWQSQKGHWGIYLISLRHSAVSGTSIRVHYHISLSIVYCPMNSKVYFQWSSGSERQSNDNVRNFQEHVWYLLCPWGIRHSPSNKHAISTVRNNLRNNHGLSLSYKGIQTQQHDVSILCCGIQSTVSG